MSEDEYWLKSAKESFAVASNHPDVSENYKSLGAASLEALATASRDVLREALTTVIMGDFTGFEMMELPYLMELSEMLADAHTKNRKARNE